MKLAEMEIREFATVLASDAPAPGGGSVEDEAGNDTMDSEYGICRNG